MLKLQDICNKTYKEQAIWFLNAFWTTFGEKEAENVWKYKHQMDELDNDKKGSGNGVDELQAHRFLEKFHETMTVQTMREKLRSTGALGPNERPKTVPLIHYLLIRYNADWHILLNGTGQGGQEEVKQAERMLQEVQTALRAAEEKSQEAAKALKEAKTREAAAKAAEQAAKDREAAAKKSEQEAREREADALAREAELRAAQEEVESALAELKAQEDEYNSKTAEVKRKSEQGSVVQMNKAKNELAQHLSADPLPLRKAKITQEAAVKKAERATKAAAEARAAASQARAAAERDRSDAEEARRQAEKARAQSEKAKEAADAALDEAQQKVQEAEAYLEEAKARMPFGAVWWLERELKEAKKYLPKRQGGLDKGF